MELKAPYSAQIALDRKRAVKALLPLIEPKFSLSQAFASTDKRHMQRVTRVKTLFDWYKNIDLEFDFEDHGNGPEAKVKIDMIRSFLTCLCQPFLIAEPFNGRPGEQVAHRDLLDEIESLLD